MCNHHLTRKMMQSFFGMSLVFGFYTASAQTTDVNYADTTSQIFLLDKTQKKSNLLQATATVYTNQLITTPAPSFLQALPGKLSGLYTRQRSGIQDNDNPTGVMEFKIRGQIPTILIDGVPRDFASIEPESIQSITVLKDALSTVMFGQRSSNNIIEVTTIRPEVGPFQLSFTAQHGIQNQLDRTKMVSAADYAILYNEARNNDALAPVYSAEDVLAYQTGSDPLNHPNNDYKSMFFKDNAALDRYNVNIKGGNETARFYVALDYQKEGGFLKTAGVNTYSTDPSVDRYIVRSNISVDLTKTLNIGLNIFGRIQDANAPGNSNNTAYSAIFNTPNNAYNVFNPDGSLGGNSSYNNNIYGLLNNSGYNKSTVRDLATDIVATQKLNAITPGLWAKANLSYNNTVAQTVNRTKSFAVFGVDASNPSANYNKFGNTSSQSNGFGFDSRRTYVYGKLSLGYDKSFGDHNLSLLALADIQSTTINVDLPAKYTNIAGNATYNYKEKYFAEAALSYGGFNRFPPGKRFGVFYAGGLGWNLAKEDFLKDVKWINTLKPRVNYGRTGNANVGYYVYDQYYGGASGYYFGSNPTSAAGYSEQGLANPNATWEKADKLDVGLDVNMFASRLNLTSEYFNDTYSDLMQTRGNSTSLIGQSYPTENVGKERYSGFENNVSWNGKLNTVGYFISANATVLKTKVLYQDEVYRPLAYQRRTGMPVGQAFGYQADGFFQSQAEIDASPKIDGFSPVPGDIKYKDLNGDGIIDAFDQTAIGTQKPLMYYGLTAGFNVKNFDLSVSVQGVTNNDGFINYSSNLPSNGQFYQQSLDRWTPSNAANANYPRLSIGSNSNQTPSTLWVRSMDYLRLQNVDLGYTLPTQWVNKIKLNSVRVFANGFNLYSFDKLNYSDPENTSATYPLRRTFNFGVNIKL